jgi:TPR repeat protein
MVHASLLKRMLVCIRNLTQTAEAQYAGALQALEGTRTGWQDADRAFRYFRNAADRGHLKAIVKLGECYEDGDGVEQNPSEALRWYRRSAENGNADGQFCLGRCYFYGIGVEVDYVQAVHWLSLAAGQGKEAVDHFDRKQPCMAITTSMCFLGYCYEMGLGVEKDARQSEHWYGESAYRQHPDACRKYAEIIQAAMADTGNKELRERLIQRNRHFCMPINSKASSNRTF